MYLLALVIMQPVSPKDQEVFTKSQVKKSGDKGLTSHQQQHATRMQFTSVLTLWIVIFYTLVP